MPRLLQIAQLGHPVLRASAQPVSDIAEPDTQALIDDLLATLAEVGGLGLAAPQVYQTVQILIVACKPTPNYPDAPVLEPFALVNPTLVSTYGDTINEWEGCLSIPGLRGRVPRPWGITLQYLTREGETRTEKLEGFLARIILHEYDHLQGLVYLDHLASTHDLITEREFQRMRQQVPAQER